MMQKYLLLFVFVAVLCQAQAQNTDPLVNAERSFEKACLDKGIRDGFLAFVDSNGIIFTGNGPVSAKAFWTFLPQLSEVFTWSPSYAEMSLSGNWGYTTGNYEHRLKTINDTVNDTGQYSTVWHKTENGEWKYLIDIGNSHPRVALDKKSIAIDIEKLPAGKNENEKTVLTLEEQFMAAFEKNIVNAYQVYGSSKYILSVTGYLPVTSTDSTVLLIQQMGSALKFHPAGAKISPGKDMAAVYGTFDHHQVKGNYLRIWRHEKTGWKIALEVLKK